MLNYDVITMICAQISDRSDDPGSVPKDLLSVGLVSKKFLEPALDGMWKRIRSLQPLLCVLPEATLVNGKKRFLQPIAASSWDRLHFYTSRVREFGAIGLGSELDVHSSVYAHLSQGKTIFPKLERLYLTPTLCSPHSFALFVGTRMQVVSWPSLTWGWPDADTESDLGPSLALLVAKNPGLKSLELGQYSYSGLSLSLSCLRDLENLSTPLSLSLDSIQVIALLPKLTYLELTLPSEIPLDYTGVESGFPLLTKISLGGSAFKLREFLAVARPKALLEMSINLDFEPALEQSTLSDIAAITHSLPSLPLLRRLEIDGDNISSLPVALGDDLQFWSIFEPLLELKRLEYLNYCIPLPVSDQKTVRIACAWPHLKDLALYSPGDLSSLESLVHFARHCPDLESLCYPIKLRTIIPLSIPPPTLSLHPLHTFETQWEFDPIYAPAIVLGLYQIFPNLMQVCGLDARGDTLVRGILDSFIFLRNQNRRFEEQSSV